MTRLCRTAALALLCLGLLAADASAGAPPPICAPAACVQKASRTLDLRRSSWEDDKRARRRTARTRRATSLRVAVKVGPGTGVRPRVHVYGPRGFHRAIGRSTTFRDVRPGRYEIHAPALDGTARTTTYATYKLTKARLRRGVAGWVGVRYMNRVSSSTRVAQPSAVLQVTTGDGDERRVVVDDPEQQVRPGSVLAAGVGPATPSGLLLEVRTVTRDGRRATVTGVPAPLSAIGPQGEISARPRLTMSGEEFARAAGAPVAKAAAKGGKDYDEPVKCKNGVAAKFGGEIEFDANTDVGVSWGGWTDPLTVKAYIRAQIRQAARIKVVVEGKAECELDKDLLAKDHRFSPWTFTVGPVPVVIVPKANFRVYGEASVGATFTTTVVEKLNTTFGLMWDGDKGVPFGESTAEFSHEGMTIDGNMSVKAAIGPKLIFDVYDVAGPYLTAGVFLRLKADSAADPWWRLAGGIEAGGGLRFKVWKVGFDYGRDDIFDQDWTIAKAKGPLAPAFVTPELPDATAGQAYNAQLTTHRGRKPLKFAVLQGALPAGLKLDAAKGRISGTPTANGTHEIVLGVTDALGQQGTKQYRIKAPSVPPAITTPQLPDATVGAPYREALAATGSVTPYVWTLAAGALPDGLRLERDGTVAGTPTAFGAATFTVKVQGADGKEATRELTLTVKPAPVVVTSTVLPNAKADVAYARTLTASGGRPPYRWSGQTLPAWLALDADGRLAGTPTVPADHTLTVKVTDADGRIATEALALKVLDVDAVAIGTRNLPAAQVAEVYDQTLAATGGRAPYTWTAQGLPDGLILAADGRLTGTPTADGTATVQVTAKDREDRTATATIALTVLPRGLGVATTALDDATIHYAYTATLAGTGGVAPYTWSAESLPAGLALDAGTGAITGAPTVGGDLTFTVEITDSENTKRTGTVTLKVYNHGPGFVDVDCPEAGFCVALDDQNNAYVRSGGTWSAPELLFNRYSGGGWTAGALDCTSATFCIAVNADGTSREWNGTSWSAPVTPAGTITVADVDCATATMCAAVGSRRITSTQRGPIVARYDGASWSWPTPGGNESWSWETVGCPAVDSCVATDSWWRTGRFNGTAVTLGADLPFRPWSLACASMTLCIAGGAGTATFNGSAWNPVTFSAGSDTLLANPVGCTKGGSVFCAAAGGNDFLWTSSNGTAWTKGTARNDGVSAIACTSATACTAMTWAGGARRWDGTSWSDATPVVRFP